MRRKCPILRSGEWQAVGRPNAKGVPVRRIVAVACIFVLGACASDGGGSAEPATDADAVEAAVRASIEAENDKDTDAFLALWTDEGLEEYDVGSREELKAAHDHGEGRLGEDPAEIHRFDDITIENSAATAIVDAKRVESQAVTPLFRLRFELIKREGEWLLNGFEFLGGPPAEEGTDVVEIRAQEYAFVLEEGEVPGDVAFTFRNVGEEQHELTLFKGPDDLDIEQAAEDLADVDPSDLDNLPEGYQVDHISFAEPKKSVDIGFAEPMPAGTYVLACYIPQGGFPEDGEPDPNAKSHFELGMRAKLSVQ